MQSPLEPQTCIISCCLPPVPSFKVLILQDIAHTCEDQVGRIQIFRARPQSLKHTTQVFIRLHPPLHESHPRQSQNISKTLCTLPPCILVFVKACSLKAYCLISELLSYLAYVPTLLDSHLLLIFALFLNASGKRGFSWKKPCVTEDYLFHA